MKPMTSPRRGLPGPPPAARRVRRLLLVGLALGLCGQACRPVPLRLLPPDRDISASEYGRVRDAWTRKDRAYEQFESRIFACATYRSLAFRAAETAFLAREQHWPATQRAARWQEEQADHAQAHEFVLAVFTHQWAWNDFAESDSVWKIWLETDPDTRVAPLSVVRAPGRRAELEALYPCVRPFYEAYVVRFPVTTAAGQPLFGPGLRAFTLRIAGVRGQVAMTWPIQP